MKLTVLLGIAENRARLQNRSPKREPPYVCHLLPKRAAKLRKEMDSAGISFGIPFGGFVPDPSEDEDREWSYLGTILGDVHVFVASS